MKKIFILLAVLTLSISCKREMPGNSLNSGADEKQQDTTTVTTIEETPTEVDTIKYDTVVFPDIDEENNPVKIITTGRFHEDEVWGNVSEMKWLGLFAGKKGYYVSNIKVISKKVYDPVLDEDNKKTGWEITAPTKDSTVLFISGCEYISPNKVINVIPEKTQLLPGETTEFDFDGKKYTLYALGATTTRQNETTHYNYKLYIAGRKGPKPITTLLVAVPSFDDAMIRILFIGDIDGDGLPDLILDTASHYNVTSPTLYLSKPAGENELLKAVSIHSSVGC